jgi:hypothetical protein
MQFLTGANASNDPLWPLDFMVQAVPQTDESNDVEIGDGWEPWRFPAIDPSIKQVVARGIAGNANAHAVFATMRDFTVLQRLFRLALAGELGLSFPLDELIKLQKATATFIKVERNERWNGGQELGDLLYSEQERLESMLSTLESSAGAPDQCREAARRALASRSKEPWPRSEGLWPLFGGVETACRGFDGSHTFSERLNLLRKYDLVDEAIIISRTISQRREALSCPPL